MIIAPKASQRLANVLLWTAGVVLVFPVYGDVRADPPDVTLESLRQFDTAGLPAYTLRVTIEEPVQTVFRRQGIARYACVLTRGAPGFAASCKAEELPKPIYQPPGSSGYMEPEYDIEGNLAVGMRSKWLTLSTATTNETYDEGRTFFVNRQGAVLKRGGVSGTLSRYPPDDLWGWSLSKLRRVWWALGRGLPGDFESIVSASEPEGLRRVEIRSKLEGRWPGVWRAAFDTQASSLIRVASFISNARSDVSVEVTSKGVRQFGSVTLAEEGVVCFPHPHNPFETRVVLKDFEARFDEGLFKQVEATLKRVRADDTVKVLDYPRGPPTPPAVTTHP